MIDKFSYHFPYRGANRMIHVYLPPNYTETQQYPVMYLFDGHNLFHDDEATYGTSWGLEAFMDQYDKPLILVGIECSHEGNERLAEYSPYDFKSSYLGEVHGYGRELMEWLVYDLKPFIDQRYATYPWRECTGIGGSSMGGLMAFYGMVAYNRFFSKAACLSPSLVLCADALQQEMNQSVIDADTRVYFSYGEGEVARYSGMMDATLAFNDQLVERGARCYIHVEPGGQHNEATWRAQNRRYMDFLWK